jgi:molybdopterin converting factor small subunit
MSFALRYFGSLREALGRERERIDPPSHILTVDDLIGRLSAPGEPYAWCMPAAAVSMLPERRSLPATR